MPLTLGVESDLRFWEPLFYDRRELCGAYALAAAVVGEVRELGLEREANELLGAIVFVDPGVARFWTEGKSDRLAYCGLGGEMLGPHYCAALAAVAEDDGWARADDAGAGAGDVAASHVLVEEFHDGVRKCVSGGIAEIVFRDRAIAVRILRGAVNGFATGEDETGEFAMDCGFEHVASFREC